MRNESQKGLDDLNRRTVLKAAGAAGVLAATPLGAGQAAAVLGETDLDVASHKFTDELPRPGVLRPTSRKGGVDQYEIELTEFSQTVLPSSMGMDTTVWGYEGSFPGPTIEATPGDPVEVKYVIDNLGTDGTEAAEHLLSVDHNVHGAESSNPDVRISTHLHGGVVAPEDDGYPEAWASPDGTTHDEPIEYKQTKEYPNDQRPGTLWYHDHALGITRLNVYAGLAGFYLLRDHLENQLPNRQYEVPIVIQDRTFDPNGELFYPPGDDNNYEAEFAGDIPVVNGKAYPKFTVEPRTYRLRFLNGSNGRAFNLKLYNEDAAMGEEYTDVPLMKQIGVDLGFLEEVVEVGPGGTVGPQGPIDSLLLSGAERADTIVDFSGYEGQTFTLRNDAPFPYAGIAPDPDNPTIDSMTEIMQIQVQETGSRGDSIDIRLPRFLDQINQKYPDPEVEEDVQTRTHTLASAGVSVDSSVTYDTHFLNLSFWDDGVEGVTPELGTSETWELVNLTGDSHPIHLHLVDFEVKEREGFTWNDSPFGEDDFNTAAELYVNDGGPKPDFNDYVTFDGNPTLPNPNNAANKDTVLVNPQEVVRIEPAFTGYTGLYPWHCHILEHEDQEMMLPYKVIDGE